MILERTNQAHDFGEQIENPEHVESSFFSDGRNVFICSFHDQRGEPHSQIDLCMSKGLFDSLNIYSLWVTKFGFQKHGR